MGREEAIQAGMAFQIAFGQPADVSMGRKLVTLGFLMVEQCKPVPAVTYGTQRWGLEDVDHMPLSLVLLAHRPLGFALSPSLWGHYTALFWGVSTEMRKSTYWKCCTIWKTFCRNVQFPWMAVVVHEQAVCEWTFSDYFNSFLYPVALKLWLKVPATLLPPPHPCRGPLPTRWSVTSAGMLRRSRLLPRLIFSDALFIWALIKGPQRRTEGIF